MSRKTTLLLFILSLVIIVSGIIGAFFVLNQRFNATTPLQKSVDQTEDFPEADQLSRLTDFISDITIDGISTTQYVYGSYNYKEVAGEVTSVLYNDTLYRKDGSQKVKKQPAAADTQPYFYSYADKISQLVAKDDTTVRHNGSCQVATHQGDAWTVRPRQNTSNDGTFIDYSYDVCTDKEKGYLLSFTEGTELDSASARKIHTEFSISSLGGVPNYTDKDL